MKISITNFAAGIIAFALLSISNAHAAGPWHVYTKGASGPLVQVALPDAGNKRRTAFIAFEYLRRCDPIFSFAEISGNRLGAAISQSVLKDSKIGVVLNGNFYTWHAATTKYDNGYEAGFGVTNELLLQFLINLDSLEYVTPSGERVGLPTLGFREAIQSALDACRKRIN